MWSNTPLTGIKVVEFAGLAPAPFAGMVLADFGADVIRVDKPNGGHSQDILARGKRSISVSAKTKAGRNILTKLIKQSDVLIDPFRPGVLEKLGLGPDEMLKINPKLIYARMYGFEKDSKYADMAGHDINYSALSGVLSLLGQKGQKPNIPLNILADFAGGGIMCAMGILLALVERSRSKRGQVVNTDMVSGLRYIASFSLIMKAATEGILSKSADLLVLDGSLPYYTIYETKDGRYITVGALEPRFYAIFIETLRTALQAKGIRSRSGDYLHQSMPMVEDQFISSKWPDLRAFLEEAFLTQTRDEWDRVFLNTDSCVAPVLEPSEAQGQHGSSVPKPAPLLARTPARTSPTSIEKQLVAAGGDTVSVLRELGLSLSEIHALQEAGDIEAISISDKRRSKL